MKFHHNFHPSGSRPPYTSSDFNLTTVSAKVQDWNISFKSCLSCYQSACDPVGPRTCVHHCGARSCKLPASNILVLLRLKIGSLVKSGVHDKGEAWSGWPGVKERKKSTLREECTRLAWMTTRRLSRRDQKDSFEGQSCPICPGRAVLNLVYPKLTTRSPDSKSGTRSSLMLEKEHKFKVSWDL